MPDINRQFLLARRPEGRLRESDFGYRETPVPGPGPGEVLTRTVYLSLDPANRAWMFPDPTYRPPIRLGEVMAGFTLNEVVDSRDPRFRPGDLVECEGGWQDYAVLPGDALYKLEPREPLSHWMSVLGVTGKTAYFGLLEVGRVRAGETVLVSAAAGAVGSFAGQLAKLHGCRVIGIAGGPEKCRWLTGELGFDAAIDYQSGDLSERLADCCPEGVDVYFDNVGGAVFQAALLRMKQHGRIVCCGVVSILDTDTPPPRLIGVPGLLAIRRLRLEGFIVMDFYDRRKQAERALAGWVAEGRLKVREDIIDGLENAPRALMGLLHGANIGKRMIRVAPEPSRRG
ncbi:NADP-dependent oxidoreductase [Archangium gephyra]|uniref:NADP-dependent oxidoreductase n=1 Tax=Archangium gephyra TaxID=48 RepID=UPI0035D3DF64